MRRLILLLAAMPPSTAAGADVRPIVPVMLRVPAGRFVAGSPPAETDAVHYPAVNAAREQPARTVIVARPFALGRTEVTRAAFARFVAATGWRPDGPCSFLADPATSRYATDPAHDWLHPGFRQTGRHPVVCVDVADAEAYARWLSAGTGRHFRLPSNTEWEYAARAGTTTALWWGDTPGTAICRYANVRDAGSVGRVLGKPADPATVVPCDDHHAATAPVASYRPNPWGFHDMIGNVWELTRDCLNADQRDAPTDTRPRDTGICTSRIDRGASWGNTPKYVRAAAQHPDLVGARTAVLGFRLAEDLAPAAAGPVYPAGGGDPGRR